MWGCLSPDQGGHVGVGGERPQPRRPTGIRTSPVALEGHSKQPTRRHPEPRQDAHRWELPSDGKMVSEKSAKLSLRCHHCRFTSAFSERVAPSVTAPQPQARETSGSLSSSTPPPDPPPKHKGERTAGQRRRGPAHPPRPQTPASPAQETSAGGRRGPAEQRLKRPSSCRPKRLG